MVNYFYSLSDAYILLSLIAIAIIISLIVIILNKHFIFPKLKYKDNTITASAASLIGIIYGVLAGFICLYLMTNNDNASNAALNEGSAAANIYRDSKWLRDPYRQQIQTDLKTYITHVINDEWPAMSKGKELTGKNGYMINKMSDILMSYPVTTKHDELISYDLIQEINTLFDARELRIQMSESGLSPEIWEVILIGTLLIIIINYAFRVNFYLHAFSIIAFSIMAASVLFLFVTLDKPFQGEFIVEPTALQAVLDTMDHDMKPGD